MIIVGLLMAIITLYNYFTAPRTETSIAAKQIVKAQKRIFSSFSSFFQKKQIGLALTLS
jgi:PAT family beta-lactamase induction signal transducer AmpG